MKIIVTKTELIAFNHLNVSVTGNGIEGVLVINDSSQFEKYKPGLMLELSEPKPQAKRKLKFF